MMGVDYDDKSAKQYLRAKVKAHVLQYIDMKLPFGMYPYHGKMIAIIKRCTAYMNGSILTADMKPWTRDTTEEVIKSIFEDDKRNENARAKAALKRAKERAEKVRTENLYIPVADTNRFTNIYRSHDLPVEHSPIRVPLRTGHLLGNPIHQHFFPCPNSLKRLW
jgi:hypothetical protein